MRRGLTFIVAAVVAVGCVTAITPYPPPALTVADAHRLAPGSAELLADGTAVNGLGGVAGGGVHVGLPRGFDLALHAGWEAEGVSAGLQLAGQLWTRPNWEGDWTAGVAGSFNWGSPCPWCHGGYRYATVAPSIGVRSSSRLSKAFFLSVQARVSYSRAFAIIGLEGIGRPQEVWFEPMAGISWHPLRLLRCGLGFGFYIPGYGAQSAAVINTSPQPFGSLSLAVGL